MPFLSHKNAFRKSSRLILHVKSPLVGYPSNRKYGIVASKTYNDAINLLNTLQTPHKVLQEGWKAGIKPNENGNLEMRRCLARLGYSQNDLTKLNVVHVAGTKGKGTTCAYVDSILRQYRESHGNPKKVGLFTSPHLIAVRERIRLNSAPISAALFAKYFFEVWERLEATATPEDSRKPSYFRYLTLMSCHVFIQEAVDVAVYEVGMGGEFDATNLIDNPAVTGISTLGIDHTHVLGNTIDEIAWNKAGIQKKDVPSFTVEQKPGAMRIIEERAIERSVKSLDLVKLDSRLEGVKVKPDAAFQKGNASLAISLTEEVLKKIDPTFKRSTSLPQEFIDGIEQVVWRGRCETKHEGNITWYLDGAHTEDSVVVATKWFNDTCFDKPGSRVLIFNQQGHRDSVGLLNHLYAAIKSHETLRFDHIIFCPAVPSTTSSKNDFVNLSANAVELAGLTMQKAFAEQWKVFDPSSQTKIAVLPSVEDALQYVRELGPGTEGEEQVHAFITGSVHLVGRALGTLEGIDAV